jgi:hypothetical protein
VYAANLASAYLYHKTKAYSGDILPLAGDMSTEISDLRGLFSSSFNAKAMTAFPPLDISYTTRSLTYMLWPRRLTPEFRLSFWKNAAMSVAIAA